MISLVYACVMLLLALLCRMGASTSFQRMRLSVVPWRTLFTKPRHRPFFLFTMGMALQSALVFVTAVGIGFWFASTSKMSEAFQPSVVASYSVTTLLISVIVTYAFTVLLYTSVDTGPVLLACIGGALPQAAFVLLPMAMRTFSASGLTFRGDESLTEGQFWALFIASAALTEVSSLAQGLLQMRLVQMRWTFITFAAVGQAFSSFLAALSPWLFVAVVSTAYPDQSAFEVISGLPDVLGLGAGATVVTASQQAERTVQIINLTLSICLFSLPVAALALVLQGSAAFLKIRELLRS